jgi:hypothetical protein
MQIDYYIVKHLVRRVKSESRRIPYVELEHLEALVLKPRGLF